MPEALKPWANKPQVGQLGTWTCANFLRLTIVGSGTSGNCPKSVAHDAGSIVLDARLREDASRRGEIIGKLATILEVDPPISSGGPPGLDPSRMAD
jgi:hypothetical protein